VFQSDSLGLKFGTMGSGKDQFKEPYDITIDNFAKQIFVIIRKLTWRMVLFLQIILGGLQIVSH